MKPTMKVNVFVLHQAEMTVYESKKKSQQINKEKEKEGTKEFQTYS